MSYLTWLWKILIMKKRITFYVFIARVFFHNLTKIMWVKPFVAYTTAIFFNIAWLKTFIDFEQDIGILYHKDLSVILCSAFTALYTNISLVLYILLTHLDDHLFLRFMKRVLRELLTISYCFFVRGSGCNKTLALFSVDFRNHLDATFPCRWIGNEGHIPWPSGSFDMNFLNYFLWLYLTSLPCEHQWNRTWT